MITAVRRSNSLGQPMRRASSESPIFVPPDHPPPFTRTNASSAAWYELFESCVGNPDESSAEHEGLHARERVLQRVEHLQQEAAVEVHGAGHITHEDELRPSDACALGEQAEWGRRRWTGRAAQCDARRGEDRVERFASGDCVASGDAWQCEPPRPRVDGGPRRRSAGSPSSRWRLVCWAPPTARSRRLALRLPRPPTCQIRRRGADLRRAPRGCRWIARGSLGSAVRSRRSSLPCEPHHSSNSRSNRAEVLTTRGEY